MLMKQIKFTIRTTDKYLADLLSKIQDSFNETDNRQIKDTDKFTCRSEFYRFGVIILDENANKEKLVIELTVPCCMGFKKNDIQLIVLYKIKEIKKLIGESTNVSLYSLYLYDYNIVSETFNYNEWKELLDEYHTIPSLLMENEYETLHSKDYYKLLFVQ